MHFSNAKKRRILQKRKALYDDAAAQSGIKLLSSDSISAGIAYQISMTTMTIDSRLNLEIVDNLDSRHVFLLDVKEDVRFAYRIRGSRRINPATRYTVHVYMSTVLLCISNSNREIKGNDKRGGIGSMGAYDAHAKQLML